MLTHYQMDYTSSESEKQIQDVILSVQDLLADHQG